MVLGAFPASRSRFVLAGAILWTLSIAFFVVQVVAQAASSVPYHLTTNLISDLGSTACGPDVCSPLHGLVNATYVAVGIFHGAGAILTHLAWPSHRLRDAARSVMVVAGVGLAVAGLAPENLNAAWHSWGALTGLTTLNVAMIFYGLSLGAANRRLAGMTAGAGMIGLAGLVLFLGGSSIGSAGITERLADYPAAAMVVVLGLVLLVSVARRSRP